MIAGQRQPPLRIWLQFEAAADRKSLGVAGIDAERERRRDDGRLAELVEFYGAFHRGERAEHGIAPLEIVARREGGAQQRAVSDCTPLK